MRDAEAISRYEDIIQRAAIALGPSMVELDKAKAEVASLREWRDQFDCCMCGSLMTAHDIGSGHSPVSMYDYHMGELQAEVERLQGSYDVVECRAAALAKEVERLTATLAHIVSTYDRDNPLRTGDAHYPDCPCMRCAIDNARA